MVPVMHKTATYEGGKVQNVMSRFALATPEQLGVDTTRQWDFGRTTQVEARCALGSGLHGRVFSVASSSTMFVKTFDSLENCAKEKNMLDALYQSNISRVPLVKAVSADKLAFLASPVCMPLDELRGQTVVWRLGAKFVHCLQQAHQANFCHRDIRPSNIGYISSETRIDDSTEVILFDWASAVETGTKADSSGTVHYAASAVLDKLANRESPDPLPSHDLESLVYTMWDLSRQLTSLPTALSVNGSLNDSNSEEYINGVKSAWAREKDQYPALAELLHHARSCSYTELERSMLLKG